MDVRRQVVQSLKNVVSNFVKNIVLMVLEKYVCEIVVKNNLHMEIVVIAHQNVDKKKRGNVFPSPSPSPSPSLSPEVTKVQWPGQGQGRGQCEGQGQCQSSLRQRLRPMPSLSLGYDQGLKLWPKALLSLTPYALGARP